MMKGPSGITWVTRAARVMLGLALAGAAACDGAVLFTGAEVTPVVKTQARIVEAGGTMEYEIANGSLRSFGYSACPASLERLEGGAWIDASGTVSRICITIGLTLAPLQTESLSVRVPDVEGTYRIRFHLHDYSHGNTGEFVAISNTFRARAAQLRPLGPADR